MADDAVLDIRNTTVSVSPLAHCLLPRTAMVVFETEYHVALLRWLRRETVDQPVI